MTPPMRRVTLGNSYSSEGANSYPILEDNDEKLKVVEQSQESTREHEDDDDDDDDYELDSAQLQAFSQQFSQDFNLEEILRHADESKPSAENDDLLDPDDELIRQVPLPDDENQEFDLDDELIRQVPLPGEAVEHSLDPDDALILQVPLPPHEAAVPSRNKKPDSPASREPKRQRIEKQSKITDAFQPMPPGAPAIAMQPRLRETDSSMFCRGILYKKDETWTSNEEELTGLYFTIARLDINRSEKCRKEAVCPPGNVHILLSKTFIGPEQSKRLRATKIQCRNTWNILQKGRIPLQLLHHRATGGPLEKKIVWDSGSKESKGIGFTCAYRDNVKRSFTKRVLRRKPVVLDLFAGCGGMTEGFKAEGFDEGGFKVEINRAAAATLEWNNPKALVFPEDAGLFLENCKARRTSLYPQPGAVHHVHASTPCQGFSRANRFGGKNDEANNRLTYHFVAVVKYFLPRTATFENVTGMLLDENLKYLQEVVTELLLIGYQVRISILDASDYGDPQKRERVILFAAKKGYTLPDSPRPTHGVKFGCPKVSVKAALQGLESITPVRGSGVVELPDKTAVWNHNHEGTDEKNDMYHLVADEPAKTVRRGNAIKHYKLPRCLTIRERARIQSFPDSFKFFGELREQNNQIGNAVPVNLARAIARSVMESHMSG